jgi:hypothetical protein
MLNKGFAYANHGQPHATYGVASNSHNLSCTLYCVHHNKTWWTKNAKKKANHEGE